MSRGELVKAIDLNTKTQQSLKTQLGLLKSFYASIHGLERMPDIPPLFNSWFQMISRSSPTKLSTSRRDLDEKLEEAVQERLLLDQRLNSWPNVQKEVRKFDNSGVMKTSYRELGDWIEFSKNNSKGQSARKAKLEAELPSLKKLLRRKNAELREHDRLCPPTRSCHHAPKLKESGIEYEGPISNTGTTCKSCSSPIQIGWKVCPACGTPAVEESPTQAGPTCRSCSSALDIDWKVCPSCGTPNYGPN